MFLITAGYDVLRYSVEDSHIQSHLLNQLINRKMVYGFIFLTLTLTPDNISVLRDSGLPVVTVETVTNEFSSVVIDNVAAGKLATRHLLNLGHRRVGMITGLDIGRMHFTVPHARVDGYRSALEEEGIEWRAEYEVPGNFSYEGGAEAMKRLFSLHQPPTAVFALSDEMAIGALKMVRDMNLRVPQDLSIVGFDDNEVSEYVGLTTIRQPVADYGEHAAKQIIQQLAMTEQRPIEHIRCPTELILRTTTGPTPRE